MKIKLADKHIQEFINPDLDIIDSPVKEFNLDKTYVNTPRDCTPVTTDDVVAQGRQNFWYSDYMYGVGSRLGGSYLREEEIINTSEKKMNDIIDLYQETMLQSNLTELLKGLVRVKKSRAQEEYEDILSIVFNEIKKEYDKLGNKTIQDSTGNP